ncbi:uncharacterized protein LY89DRAFT_151910 [Mollisia scopiformis]|uniref:Uncharacterized protein n=1 Tax=Mollisia scopiformis TaxID=149040 RepID=A0A194X1D9_MOLSC|nr:uncharacterized protein LY89DRAFT_151910 [Mollisia scopiformis]KUJ14010.1 hypothetical protein LY89DRAFT_151910 [Mollisia scopiformis]
MGSPIQSRFFSEDFSIDKERTTVLLRDDATSGWLLSSPYTTTHSKMQLTKHRQQSVSPCSHSPSSMRELDFQRRAAACRQTSIELQHRCSISSEISDPGLTESDPFASTSPHSDASFEDIYNRHPPPVNREAEEKIWGEYFIDPSSPVKGSLLDDPLYHNLSSVFSSYAPTEVHLSPRCRSPNSPAGDLHRSDAVRASRDRTRHVHLPRPVPQYTPFPVPQLSEDPSPAHQSWPQRNESRTKQPSRPRAKTAPSQDRPIRPSNLINVCVIANNDIQYIPTKSSLLHGHRSAPPTPMVLPDLLEQYKSHFDEDDDEEHKSRFDSFKSRLRSGSRRGSSNTGGSWSKKSSLEKRKKGSSFSELKDALKSCFGKTK